MLLVKTYIKESEISGLGLFSNQFIQKGTLIWRFNPLIDKIIELDDVSKLSILEKDYLTKYAYRETDKLILCSDDGKYINHSTNPNTHDYIDSELGSITIAISDINIGDEIVSNYEDFDSDFHLYKDKLI